MLWLPSIFSLFVRKIVFFLDNDLLPKGSKTINQESIDRINRCNLNWCGAFLRVYGGPWLWSWGLRGPTGLTFCQNSTNPLGWGGLAWGNFISISISITLIYCLNGPSRKKTCFFLFFCSGPNPWKKTCFYPSTKKMLLTFQDFSGLEPPPTPRK